MKRIGLFSSVAALFIAAFAPRAAVEQVYGGGPDGCVLGNSPTADNPGKVGFYGITPVVRRPYSSAVHATSALATSSDFGATQLAALQEVQKTLIGLGIYATA
jgi:hypothetical protein